MKNEENFLEARIQQNFVVWYRNNYCLKFHRPRCLIIAIPNEGATHARLIASGLYPGASDTIVLHRLPNRPMRILFIETKTQEKNSKQSPAQVAFESEINNMNTDGELVSYHVVRSLKNFQEIIFSLK